MRRLPVVLCFPLLLQLLAVSLDILRVADSFVTGTYMKQQQRVIVCGTYKVLAASLSHSCSDPWKAADLSR